MTHVNADTVDKLKREFEKIIDRKNPIMLEHRPEDRAGQIAWEQMNKAWQEAYYCHPNTSQAMTLQKRVYALNKFQPALYLKLLPIVQEAIAKQAEIMVAKDQALKNRNARKAAQQEKRDDAEATKKNPYRKLHPMVAAIMREVAEPYRVEAVKWETNRLNNIVNEIKSKAAMFGSFDPDKMFPHIKGDHWNNQVRAIKITEAMPFLDRTGEYHNYTWALSANVDGIVKAKAERFAEDQVTAFVYKVGTKLSGIVERKGNLAKTSISGDLRSHWMTFEFADNANFQVQSQIVWKVSVNGVHFTQYPNCFRNVTLSNGTKMELPSEAKMKEAFV